MEQALSCLLLLQKIPWFGWWNIHLDQRPEGDPSGRSVRTGHGLCCLLSHDLPSSFIQRLVAEFLGQRSHRIIATKEPLCVDCETCLIHLFSKFTPSASTASCDNYFKICMKIQLLFVSNSITHNFFISLLVLRLWETVSIAFSFPFSIFIMVLQTRLHWTFLSIPVIHF